MNKPYLKQEIMKIIYPCTSANYFQVDNTSNLYKKADDISVQLIEFISKNVTTEMFSNSENTNQQT